MRTRSLKTGLGVGLLSLVLLVAGCGDSGDDSSDDGSTDGSSSDVSEELAQVDCGTLDHDTDAPSGGDFVDFAYLSDSGTNTTFDPAAVQTLSEAQITNSLFDGLTEFDFTEKCAPELKGLVAESWEANDDATEWTFQIKEGLTFSNGDPVLPSSFKLGWERAATPAITAAYGYLMDKYIVGGAEMLAGEADEISGIVADDDAMTLTVEMAAANADFPAIVTHTTFSPITVDEAEAKSDAPPGWGDAGVVIGNGPFMLESADENQVVLVPNPEWAGNVYGDTEVKLDTLTFRTTIDVDTAYTNFESGQGHSGPVPPGKYTVAQEKFPNNTITSPNMGTYFFDFGADSVLGGEENVKLRQAISLAIDREEINDKVYEGTRTISTGITPPGIPGFTEDLCDYCSYDPDRAKELYDEWVADGGELDGPIRLDYNEGGGHGDVAQVIQANLSANLGLDAELAGVAEDYFKVVAEPGGCVVCRSGWYADYPTYGNFMVDLFSAASIDGNNFGRFDNDEFEDLIAEAQAETDDVRRGELYAEAEALLLNEETAAIPLNWYTGSQVFRDTVINYDQPPLGMMLWERIAVSE